MTGLQPGEIGAGAAARTIEAAIPGRARDIGGFEVRRVLPVAGHRMVGPFIFLDEMGPKSFAEGQGIDVRPHPHIGLATVTYLFSGEIMHRDSLGTAQPIRPGEVNWMTAGSGIVHSERTAPERRRSGGALHGIQSWVALPQRYEETAPAFAHHGHAALPVIEGEGKTVRLIAGALFGARSPVAAFSDLFYADAQLAVGARLDVPADYAERGVYIVSGSITIDGETHGAGQLLVLRPGTAVALTAPTAARLMLLGGERLDGERYIFWNFVSSSKERLEQAKADWKAGRFAAVPGETERIPLPE
jgi:redox-sensitive bicupin YhaK (pirin superfamily)